MKRFGNLYEKIISIDNLKPASLKAQKRKRNTLEVKKWNKYLHINIYKLHCELKFKTYRVSKYELFTIKEPKERHISKLPFRDRVVHHAILNHLEPIFVNSFIHQTYSCIKGRGIHRCSYDVRKALRNEAQTRYTLKCDIKKFYPSVNNEILCNLLRKKFKDKDLLWLLDLIINSTQGLPIGSYTSQFFGNFYLNNFDHWLKFEKNIQMLRYCDDLIIFNESKEKLHELRKDIQNYLKNNLKLELSNYQVFETASRGIDFVGYKSFHSHTLLRKSIKNRFKKMIRTNRNRKSIDSYRGWVKHCNGKNLWNKYVCDTQLN